MATLIVNPAATHPKSELIFSSSQCEDDAGQHLAVHVSYPDGARDWEEAIIGPVGDWIAPEIVTEHEERLQRTLRRRHAQRLAEVKPADAPTAERKA